MAELLGLVASGAGIAALAGQIGSTIFKLKGAWARIKNAGEEIRYLIEEIEILSVVLFEISDCNNREEVLSLPTDSVERSLDLCRKGVEILSKIVIGLNQQISRRQLVGGLKATLKAGTINQLRERLRTAQFLLMLSYQIYLE